MITVDDIYLKVESFLYVFDKIGPIDSISYGTRGENVNLFNFFAVAKRFEVTIRVEGASLAVTGNSILTDATFPDFDRYLFLIYKFNTVIKQLYHQQVKCVGGQVNNSCFFIVHSG